jgi:hypothetical protein
MTRFCLITALFGSLLVGPAKAVTYYIDGVFATKTYDAVLCYSGPGCDRYAVSSVSESLSGTVDITNGVLTGFNLNADTSNYTIPGPEYLITNFNSANS